MAAKKTWFAAYAGAVLSVALLSALVLALAGPLPALLSVVVLGAVFTFTENQVVLTPSGSTLSAGFMVGMAAVVVFRDDAPLLGPLLVGMCGGLDVEQVRGRSWAKVAVNTGIYGLATMAAAGAYLCVPERVLNSVLGQVLAAVPAGLTFSLANYLLLVPALALLRGGSFSSLAEELWLGDLQIFPFALLGVLLGRLYVDVGAWVVPLFVAPIVIARQTFSSYINLRSAQEATLRTLICALESKDRYTAGHVERVAQYSEFIGQELGFRSARIERLRYAALMHDIGKLVIPNQLLNKPGRLTASEFERVRYHESATVELLQRIDFLTPLVPSVASDQEVCNANSQLIEAKIIHVADAFDAMTSTRAYRRALPQEVAFRELQRNAGGQFDIECVAALIRSVNRRGARFGAGYETEIHSFDIPPPVAGTGSAGLGDLEQAGATPSVGTKIPFVEPSG